MTDDYDPARNSTLCFELALAAMREKAVRAGIYKPRMDDEQEMRWLREGPVSNSELETVKYGGEH